MAVQVSFSSALGLALTGAVLGVLAVLGLAAPFGLLVLFALPPVALFLALSGLVAAIAMSCAARLGKGLRGRGILIGSAILTCALFALLPLYFLARGSTRGGLLF